MVSPLSLRALERPLELRKRKKKMLYNFSQTHSLLIYKGFTNVEDFLIKVYTYCL